VIVNNNLQQELKKGRVIIDEAERLRIVQALRAVDHAMISIDEDSTVCASIESIAQRHPDHRIIFGNGGDRHPGGDMPPEADVCERHGVEMIFDMGGNEKADSSSRLIEELNL